MGNKRIRKFNYDVDGDNDAYDKIDNLFKILSDGLNKKFQSLEQQFSEFIGYKERVEESIRKDEGGSNVLINKAIREHYQISKNIRNQAYRDIIELGVFIEKLQTREDSLIDFEWENENIKNLSYKTIVEIITNNSLYDETVKIIYNAIINNDPRTFNDWLSNTIHTQEKKVFSSIISETATFITNYIFNSSLSPQKKPSLRTTKGSRYGTFTIHNKRKKPYQKR